MARAGGTETTTQDHGPSILPSVIRWLAPANLPPTALKLRAFKIGRGRRSDVVIDDRYLSDRHVKVSPEDGTFVLEDLRSKNGTFLNGRRVRKAVLRSGDIVRIGDAIGLIAVASSTETPLSASGEADFLKRLDVLGSSWRLSQAQLRTLARLAIGEPNKVIAGVLHCSESNVEAHVSAILAAVSAGNRTELVARFWSTPLGQGSTSE
jgi:DNA-binding CsgD family transcriptional regulator